jgi:MFS family permease
MVWPVYVPSALFGIGEGAIAPVMAIVAAQLGASFAVASLVVGTMGIGRVLSDVPAGMLAERIGDRRTMLCSVVLSMISVSVCLLAVDVWMLAIGAAGLGGARAGFGLARHAYMTVVIPYVLRARALSTLGGLQRAGLFVGPLCGGAAITVMGTAGAFWIAMASSVLAGIALAVVRDPEVHDPAPSHAAPTAQVLREHLPVLRTLGSAAMLAGIVRASRQVVIPLWGSHIGLDPALISVIFGLSGAVDMLLFYPAGVVMDRAGRNWVAVPSMLIIGIAHFLLPLTDSALGLGAVALVMGFGNGMSAGVIAVVGSDASPEVGRSAFLGAWRLCADVGNGAGPLLIGAIAAAASLTPAILTTGAIGGLAAAAFARWVPQHTRKPPPADTKDK